MKRLGLAAQIALALICAGCAVTPTFTTGYRVAPPADAQPTPLAGSLAVRRFTDERPARLYTTQGRVFLLYVPLVPYVSLDFERLDETVPLLSAQIPEPGMNVGGAIQNRAPEQSTYSYPSSMAKAVADDLAARRLFRSVEYVGDQPAGDEEYVLNGTLIATPLRMSATSFGLGMPGVLLWLVPVPMVKATGGVELRLTLTESGSGRVVWDRTLRAEVSELDNFYTSTGVLYGGGAFSYQMLLPPDEAQVDRDSLFAWQFEALRRGMSDGTPSLEEALRASP